ncbi:hypothetical protein KFK14_07470 [Sphingobium phenoxybenzoativorans]|jgi:hypothetical protein|uniref:Uncharacterized protein n=1 Tax=Sphingobium phenoxybenzoativorans TaxID=1592790 RepID=A0A975Q2V0_9SPHN|nr:hypothetical protein [Sphingobium phenoxybenzoativorans]QUT07239.1 hypothetical protein KFK14_07470 [Sphingobium phenoxybenzoativorans]
MKPITKAMTAALSALIATTTACAAPGERPQRGSNAPNLQRPRAIAATADGFVIRAVVSDMMDATPAPVTRRHVPVGSGTHLDARLLSGSASAFQETSHAHP